ncbi:hypothetical protein HPP92_026496 [Vanilla planifolia]|uniref:Uncharacterized protein n=1 Tax=Vanilla planifolia TaxID=51239 RepID=A0A835PC85_VANPL|nr:hypothetical protein HPP92_026719 [Vanilla planifolia]KAG0451025.1 hypothetical protein HPP92_026496 [Vanilla planifolia]
MSPFSAARRCPNYSENPQKRTQREKNRNSRERELKDAWFPHVCPWIECRRFDQIKQRFPLNSGSHGGNLFSDPGSTKPIFLIGSQMKGQTSPTFTRRGYKRKKTMAGTGKGDIFLAGNLV